MKKTFKTKVDGFGYFLTIGVATLYTMGFIIILLIDDISLVNGLIAVFLSLLFWGYSFLAIQYTDYTVDEKHISARFAYFIKRTVRIDAIQKIQLQKFGLYTHGLSKDVVSIRLKDGSWLNVTPKDKEIFVTSIQYKM